MKQHIKDPLTDISEKGNTPSFWLGAGFVVLIAISALLAFLLLAPLKKQLQLIPHSASVIDVFADTSEPTGTSEARWIDQTKNQFSCVIAYGVAYPYCGVSIKYKDPHKNWNGQLDFFNLSHIDLSAYETLELDILYEGEATSLNFFMRISEELPKSFDDYVNKMYVQAPFAPHETPTRINLSELKVAAWWIDRHNSPFADRRIDLHHIIEIGIGLNSLPEPGEHRITVNSIAASRPIFSHRTLWLLLAVSLALKSLLIVIHIKSKHSLYYREENRILRDHALTDPLTQCLNRRGVSQKADEIFPVNAGQSIFLAVFDVDHFKQINDNFGHQAGDQILQEIAKLFTAKTRANDVFGRWGGEEFILLTPTDTEGVERLIQRMIASLTYIHADALPETYEVTVSAGVTRVLPDDTFADAFTRADAAMYQVKMSGRNGWRMD